MRCRLLTLLLLSTLIGLLAVPHASAADWTVIGSVQGSRIESPPSWLAGGFGRFDIGGPQRFSHREWLRLGLKQQWSATRFVLNGVVANHHDGVGMLDRGGAVELYAEHDFVRRDDTITLRVGHFFLPTSREHRDELWTSRFSVTPSAINSWVAEEIRPVGVDAAWAHTTTRSLVISAATTAFIGNDAAGALLAWRGWSFGDRLTTFGEDLPLPPLDALSAAFSAQRDATRPIGADLDGRVGYAVRARLQVPSLWTAQWLRYDNRGDRRLHRGEYSWDTSFDVVGANVSLPTGTDIAAEWMSGATGMGELDGAHVDANFSARYVLISQSLRRFRLSGRYDRFGVSDHDGSIGGDDAERGDAWLAALFYEPTDRLRVGVEHIEVRGSDDLAAASQPERLKGTSTSIEVRLRLGNGAPD